jgi:hypothetical protein
MPSLAWLGKERRRTMEKKGKKSPETVDVVKGKATRKVSSKVENGVLTLDFVNGRALTCAVEDLPDSVKPSLLLFAVKQKVTNATGGLNAEDAYAAAAEVLENLRAGKIAAERSTAPAVVRTVKAVRSSMTGEAKAELDKAILELITRKKAELGIA